MTVVNQYPIVESGPAWPFACSLLRNLGLYCYFGLDELQIQDSNIVRNFFVRFS